MPTVAWLAVALFVMGLLSMWVTFTLTRLDRLHARIDAAQAALNAQLVRRAAALLHVAESPDSGLAEQDRAPHEAVARTALNVQAAERPGAENAVGRALNDLAMTDLRADTVAELREAAARVLIARRFYNDAVRDTRTLRARRMPRYLHLAGRRVMPQFFDIDDTVPVHTDPGTVTTLHPDVPTIDPVPDLAKDVP